VVLVHGVAQQYGGAESLHAALAPALRDGVLLAGGRLAAADVSVAFYGDLFRPPGSRTAALPDYDAGSHPLDRRRDSLVVRRVGVPAGVDQQVFTHRLLA